MPVTTEIYAPYTAISICYGRALHGVYQSTSLPQRKVEPAAHARTSEDVVQQIQVQVPWVAATEAYGTHHDVSLVSAFGTHYDIVPDWHILLSQNWGLPSNGDALGGRLPCYPVHAPVDEPQHFCRIYVTIDVQHHPVRSIHPTCKCLYVCRLHGSQHVCLAQYVTPKRMRPEEEFLKFIVDEFARLVIVTLYLVDDNLHLLVHLTLGIDTAHDDVQEGIYGTWQVATEECAVVYSLLLSRVCVEVSSHALHAVDYLSCRTPTGTLETEMLREVGNSALFIPLVPCACIHGNPTVHHLGGAGGADDAESVVKYVFHCFLPGAFRQSPCFLSRYCFNLPIAFTRWLMPSLVSGDSSW